MKISVFFLIFILLVNIPLKANLLQKVETDTEKGLWIDHELSDINLFIDHQLERPENLWQTSDPAAICGDVIVSTQSQNSFARWQTNSERVSLFDINGDILWEHSVGNLDFDYPVDMLEDGSLLSVGDGNQLIILQEDSPDPIWSLTFGGSLVNCLISPSGESVYVTFNSGNNTACLSKYTIGDDTPLWQIDFAGSCGTLTLSDNDEVIIFTQYGDGYDNMFVINASDGSQIFQTDEYNQNPPAISADASIIVNGDYSGYVWVYEFQEDQETYSELWHFHVNGGGTSDWIGGMAVSADGSTIAVGTLTFVAGGYNGQIYLFNTNSPTPVWIYENAGDYVIDVDLNADGSLLAAAGYGPYGAVGDEFMLFRRQSNVPIFTIDSPGSLFAVDLAEDGSFCTTGGKAVHAREMGSGGYIYGIDCELGGGHIAGSVNLEGCEDNSGVLIEATDLTDYFAYSDPDGYYLLNNLPEGLHTLEYSKTGYETETIYDGFVIEDETTVMDTVLLIPMGEAPVDLSASQATGISIMLNWLPAAGTEPEGYFIYRKRYSGDLYPAEPLSFIDDCCTFIDDTALPAQEYYYVVSAILPDGEQSPYSNEALGYSSSGFIVSELSVYTGTEPIIDGVMGPDEWSDAYFFDASDFWGSYDNTPQPPGSVTGYLKMDANQIWLYAAFANYNDPVLEDHDEVALYIDDNGDRAYPPNGDLSEGNYWAVYYEAGNELRYRPIYNTGGVGDVVYLDNPLVAASDQEGFVFFEFAVPFGEEFWQINPGENNSSTIGIFVLDDNAPNPHGFDAWFPHDNLDIFDPAGYGVIHYDAIPQNPVPPQNLSIIDLPENILRLNWSMPEMNDFDHFNIYFALNDEQFEITDTSEGTCWIYEYEFYPQTSYSFYLTTVNHNFQESDASQIVEFFTTETEPDHIPLVTELLGNYPNPFNPVTNIRFSIADDNNRTSLIIYNIKGQKVKTLISEVLPAGRHEISWQGTNDHSKSVASGIYLYSLQNKDYHQIKKMLLLK